LIGTALSLALLSVALPSCSQGGNSSGQQASNAGSTSTNPQQWTKSTEKQLLDAIAGAPANGLKPELFLNGEPPKEEPARGQALTAAALRYADALAHGYADPKSLIDVYTIRARTAMSGRDSPRPSRRAMSANGSPLCRRRRTNIGP